MVMINKGVALRSKSTKLTTGRTPRVPDRETCMFINARFLAGERYCRRWHMNQYYANHLAPRDLKTCCKRCEEKPPPICCDLCDPIEVEKWIPVRNDKPPPRPRKTRRINVKNFTMTDSDKALRQALFRWRDEMAKAQIGEYEEYGGDILMHYRVIERIVELASVDKLKTLKNLQDQTSWAWVPEYGDEVLELIRKHRKHVAERDAQRENVVSVAESVAVQPAPRRARASPTCSACGEVGHRKNSGTCPVNIAARRAAAKSNENRPPQ
ncbi:hypothetical protein BC629DRAFT_83002 [Irpex lacteus]|nr:hypothetical protein BC629DRAFT_83002 [Irpex lacteus]